jgi:hypothetical protein
MFGLLHQVYFEINSIFKRTSRSIGHRTLRVRMDLESIALYLAMKHLGAVEIHREINTVLGEGTVGYSTRTRYLRKKVFGILLRERKRKPKSGVLIQLTMLFCKR